ncbi:hypothetical protein AMELA_G00204330 [Ameiurus melas]|uniref:Uncharacterized protein n=1 Tax=Ameiurus melas TaxID=219545 RepID=A0A7J6A2U9_AMEME|nr:hypothetical protein AMELA_G00204330 [Ameiurus melas]
MNHTLESKCFTYLHRFTFIMVSDIGLFLQKVITSEEGFTGFTFDRKHILPSKSMLYHAQSIIMARLHVYLLFGSSCFFLSTLAFRNPSHNHFIIFEKCDIHLITVDGFTSDFYL